MATQTVDYGKGTTDIDPDAIQKQLKDAAAAAGVTYDDSDYQGYLRNISYDNGGGDSAKTLGSIMDRYKERATNTPNSDGSGGGPGGSGGAGGAGGGGGNPTQITNYGPRDGGTASTDAMMDEILQTLKNVNAQPDVDVNAIDPGSIPEFTVPGENLSPAIDNTLLDMMEGQDPFGLTGRIQTLLDQTTGGGINSARLNSRNEQARERLTGAESGALADMRGSLADRGLISLPGSPQGAETDATLRTLEPLQRAYLDEVRTSGTEESKLADEGELNALQTATGWSRDQIDRRLAGAKTATERQAMLSDIALQTLDKNMQWNEFLANFGLKREQVAEEIRQGRMDAIGPILQMFEALVSQSKGGYI